MVIDKNLLHWYPDLKVGDVIEVIVQDGDETCQKSLEIAAIGDYDLGFTSFHYPVAATLMMIAVLVLVQVILVFETGKSVKKDSLIDRIRNIS